MKDKKKLNSCQKSAKQLAICMHNKRRGDLGKEKETARRAKKAKDKEEIQRKREIIEEWILSNSGGDKEQLRRKNKKKRRKPLTKKKIALLEFDVKDYIEDMYEEVEKAIYWEEIDNAEPLT